MKDARRHMGWLLAICLALTCAFSMMPTAAFADNTEEQSELEELQRQVERTAEEYDKAQADVEAAQKKIDENQKKIDALEAEMPVKRAHASNAISTHYKIQQESQGLIALLLSAESFNEFISTMTYLDIVTTKSSEAVDELVQAENALNDAHAELEKEKKKADDKLAEAEQALTAAQEARQEAQEAARRRAAEEAAAAEAARKAAAEAAAREETFKTASGNEAKVETPKESSETTDPRTDEPVSEANWGTDKPAFVAEWAPRIDAYLGGSPLGGHGTTFAEAAWDYGVDPRWSPAISCIESSKGAVCFRPHNAWGWGQVDWPDWDTAIRDHIAGLARGYGYTITPSAAQKYCPPTWQAWYSNVSSEMASI